MTEILSWGWLSLALACLACNVDLSNSGGSDTNYNSAPAPNSVLICESDNSLHSHSCSVEESSTVVTILFSSAGIDTQRTILTDSEVAALKKVGGNIKKTLLPAPHPHDIVVKRVSK